MSDPRVIAGSLARGGRWFLAGVIGIQVLVAMAVAVGNGMTRSPDPVERSVWEMPGVVWIRYPLLGLGAALVGTTLVPYLANGVTRRQYVAGAGLYGYGTCAAIAVLGIVGLGIERVVYALGGWEVDIDDLSVPLMFVSYVLLLVAYVQTGALLALSYARWRPYRATLAMVPFVLPMIGAEVLLGTWWTGATVRESAPQLVDTAIGVPATAALLVAGSWVAFALLRDLAVKPNRG